ncbi:hypothetical protein [Rhizomicrobium electricum]|uniref:Peptidase C51 domain-containing protein n=1 Tax=Rhizomicrobium electricum TaxID=480070 RepID=A0ABP3PU29_9PROT|nr:hypothetical protein [Rhizomicrobium electricum]NIJ48974.1 hypothetical protein [Rhizomicrobium electricum]
MILSAAHAGGTWRITKDHWSAADEAGFSRFVAAIGASNCSSSESCLRDPANPFRATDQKFLDIDTDCAKWPYLLRAYYAWKNGLPFSFVDGYAGSGDDKHNTTGNRPTSRRAFIDRGEGINGPAAVREVIETVNSATYRSDVTQTTGVLPDFYAPAIQPGTIRPGTVIYDTNAHVGIVYKVDEDGRIYYMDAHPDFTITRSVYGAQFGQSPLKLGGGLKNWRPQVLKGAKDDGEGYLIGGRIVLTGNDEIEDFSLVQYVGTEPNPSQSPKKARFVYDDEEMGLYTYVRTAMSGGKTEFNPLHELRVSMRNLCRDLKDRANTVNLAISEHIQDKPHPSSLPENLFDAWGDWENYATPARDARLREGFAQFYSHMARIIDLWVKRDPRIAYEGTDLRADLLAAYDTQSQACDLTYLSTDKRPVPLHLGDIEARVYAMSYDPYDCIELRWGAQGAERDGCTNGEKKMRWYAAQQRFRQMQSRDFFAGYELEDLERKAAKPMPPPPPVDVRALIANMSYQVPLEPMRPVGR